MRSACIRSDRFDGFNEMVFLGGLAIAVMYV